TNEKDQHNQRDPRFPAFLHWSRSCTWWRWFPCGSGTAAGDSAASAPTTGLRMIYFAVSRKIFRSISSASCRTSLLENPSRTRLMGSAKFIGPPGNQPCITIKRRYNRYLRQIIRNRKNVRMKPCRDNRDAKG